MYKLLLGLDVRSTPTSQNLNTSRIHCAGAYFLLLTMSKTDQHTRMVRVGLHANSATRRP